MNSIIEQIKKSMIKGTTPKSIFKRITGNNPIFNNLVEMADKGDTKGVETFARNFLKQKGLDYDTEYKKFKDKLGIN